MVPKRAKHHTVENSQLYWGLVRTDQASKMELFPKIVNGVTVNKYSPEKRTPQQLFTGK